MTRAVLCVLFLGFLVASSKAATCECRCSGDDHSFSIETANCTNQCSVCVEKCEYGGYHYICTEDLDPVSTALYFMINVGVAIAWAAYIHHRRRRLGLPTDQTKMLTQCLACFFCAPCWCCCYLYMESQELNYRRTQANQGELPNVAMAIPVDANGQPLPYGQFYGGGQPLGGQPVAPLAGANYGGQPMYAAVAVPVQEQPGGFVAPGVPSPAQTPPAAAQPYPPVYPAVAASPANYAVPPGLSPHAAMPPAGSPRGSVFTGQPHRI